MSFKLITQLISFFFTMIGLAFIHNSSWLAHKSQPYRSPTSTELQKTSWEDFTPDTKDIPNQNAILRWTNKINKTDALTDWARIKFKNLQCSDRKLYPSHPQQILKTYHVYKIGEYDHFKLNGDDEVCTIKSTKKNNKGVKLCFFADKINFVVLSDLFMDSCGNYYRGFFSLVFLKKNDSMGNLFSHGRKAFLKTNSNFEKEYEDAETYAVDLSEFLFLAEPFPEDINRSIEYRKKSLSNGFQFDDQTNIFLKAN